MYLYKHCHAEHNVRQSGLIRLGTLFDYRKIENEELRDADEGKYEFEIDFPEPITIDNTLFNSLFAGGGVAVGGVEPPIPIAFSVSIETLAIRRQLANSVELERARAVIKRSVPNCLVFCMSELDANVFATYKDKWSVPRESAGALSAAIARMCVEQAKLDRFPSIAKHLPLGGVSSLNVVSRHRPVIYRDRLLTVTTANPITYSELMSLMMEIPFVKPTKYSQEKEYRFTFEVTDGRNAFAVERGYLDLQTSVLAPVLHG